MEDNPSPKLFEAKERTRKSVAKAAKIPERMVRQAIGSGTAPIVDMGAYEGPHATGDISGDGRTNVVDVLILADDWGK